MKTPREFHEPTPAEIEQRPPLEGEAPEGERVAVRGGLWVWVWWWGRGTFEAPYTATVAVVTPKGVPVRFPTVEETHEAAQQVPLKGVIFHTPPYIVGRSIPTVPGNFRTTPLVQMGAEPESPAWFRARLSLSKP